MTFRAPFRRPSVSIHYFKKARLAFRLVLAGCLLLSFTCVSHGFMTFEHEGWEDLNTLIKKVHEDQWVIHYSYGGQLSPGAKE